MSTVETQAIPLLPGDKLTLEQFLDRWEERAELKRAELIGGIVYMPSPVSVLHAAVENLIGTWLGIYAISTPGCGVGNNATTILEGDSPQPDVHLRLLPEVGGRTTIRDKLLHGAPEFVAEVCVSSASYDLNQKYDLYREAGVTEYLAILMYEQEVRWHRLVDREYHLLSAGDDGVWRSVLFPGLWLKGAALLAADGAQVLATLQQGLNSSEHSDFVAMLKARRLP